MDLTDKQRDALTRLRAALTELDEQTRLPGEEPLVTTVARTARQRLAEMQPQLPA